MKQVSVNVWCDGCATRKERNPGHPVRAAFGNAAMLEVDLCDPCEKELVEPLRQLLADVGQSISEDAAHVCQSCGKRYKKASSLRAHVNKRHTETTEFEQPAESAVELAHACPDCDRAFSSPQGLGAHRARNHDYVSPHRREPVNA